MSDEETPLEEAPAGENSGGKKDKKVKEDKKDKKVKEDKKDKKGKKGKKSPSEGLTIAGHPRAGAQVRMAKGWGGLIAFREEQPKEPRKREKQRKREDSLTRKREGSEGANGTGKARQFRQL